MTTMQRLDAMITERYAHLLRDYDREPRIVKTRAYREAKRKKYHDSAVFGMQKHRHGGAE